MSRNLAKRLWKGLLILSNMQGCGGRAGNASIPDVRVADDALSVALFTETADGNARLLAAHDQIWMVLRHSVLAALIPSVILLVQRGADVFFLFFFPFLFILFFEKPEQGCEKQRRVLRNVTRPLFSPRCRCPKGIYSKAGRSMPRRPRQRSRVAIPFSREESLILPFRNPLRLLDPTNQRSA